jgi:hypothetical protein
MSGKGSTACRDLLRSLKNGGTPEDPGVPP